MRVTPQENQSTLEMLRRHQPGAPFPTATGGLGPTGRLAGRYATCTWGTAVLFCFEWEVEFVQEFVDTTAHGDFWKFPIPVLQSWTARIKGYALTGTAAVAATIAGPPALPSTYIYKAGRAVPNFLASDPATALFTGYSNGPVTSPTPIFAGNCWASRARWLAPLKGMATQEVELMGSGPPTTSGVLVT